MGCGDTTSRCRYRVVLDGSQAECEGCAAAWRFRQLDRAAMRGRNLGNDRKAKARARALGRAPAPEALENAMPVLFWNSGSVVGDADRSLRQHGHHDFALGRGIDDSILDQVTQGV